MSVKKNLTVATLAALLAVPAFGTTNASHVLHMPSVTAHADSSDISNPAHWYETGTSGNVYLNRTLVAKNVYQNPKGDYLNRVTGTTVFPKGDYVHIVSQGTNGIDLGISDSSHPITDSSMTLYSIPRSDATAFSTTSTNENENSSQSSNGSNNAENDGSANEEDGNSSQQSNNSSSSANSNNSSTQYASKNSLPQTGEVNNQAKRIAASIILGATSIGAGATAVAMKKHHSNNKANTYHETVASGNGGHNHKISNIIDELRTETSQLQNVTNQIVNG